MDLLGQSWPQSVSFEAIREAASKHAPAATQDEMTAALLAHVIALVQSNALHYRLEPAQYLGESPSWFPYLSAEADKLLPRA